MKMTVDELAAQLKRDFNFEIVAFIVHDPDTGVTGRVLTADCPKALEEQMNELWGKGQNLLPKTR